MNNILSIAANMTKILTRKKTNFVLFIVVPIVVISAVVSMYAFTGGGSTISLGILDMDNSNLSQGLTHYLSTIEMLDAEVLNTSSVDDALQSKSHQFVLKIPKGLSNSIINSEDIDQIQLKTTQWSSDMYFVEQYVEFYMANIKRIADRSNKDINTFNRLLRSYNIGHLDYKVIPVSNQNNGYKFTHTAMGMLLLFLMISANTSSNLIIKEKREGTFGRISMAPVKVKEYYLAHILVNICMVLVQVSSILFIMTVVSNIRIMLVGYFLLLVAFGLVCIGLGLFVVEIAGDSRATGGLLLLIVIPSCMLGGCFWPSFIMPELLQRIGYFVPQTWVIEGMTKLNEGLGLSSILLNLGVLMLFTLIFFMLSIYIHKNKEAVKFK